MTKPETAGDQVAPATKETTAVTTVKMTDGRVVDFPGKRKLLKNSGLKDGKVVVQLDFVNGQTRDFVVPDSLLARFAAHGAEQKLGDEIAGLKDIDDAVLAVDELIARLNKGEWGVTREGGSGLAGTSVLLQALVKVYPTKSVEELKAWLATKNQAEKTALRNNPKVKPVVEEIEAAKASKTAKVDTDALLGELG